MTSTSLPPEPGSAAPIAARALGPAPPSPVGWSLPRIVALFLAILGCILCGVLLSLGFGGSVLGASLCTPTQSVNCDFVLASRWARIGPLPVSALGLTYFLGLAAWLAFVGFPNHEGRRWRLVPLGTTVLGLCGSIYFVYVMAVHLPVWCTWCLAAHGVNAFLFLAILVGRPHRDKTGLEPAAYPTAARALGVLAGCGGFMILVIAVVVAVGAQMTAAKLQAEFLKIANNVDYIEWRWRSGEAREIPVRPDDLALGPAGAAHVVVVFEDFQCASCAGFHRYTTHLLQRHPDVRIVFKHNPMSKACNAYVNEGFHYFACEAARAVAAARAVGTAKQALDFQSRVFENSGRLDDRPYESLAQAAGIDPAKFTAALAGPDSAARVAEDIELAHRLGVEGTPAVFVDGRKLWNWHLLTNDARPKVDLEATEALWDRLLKK